MMSSADPAGPASELKEQHHAADDHTLATETASMDGSMMLMDAADGALMAMGVSAEKSVGCDACPHCDDRCEEPSCSACNADDVVVCHPAVEADSNNNSSSSWPPCRKEKTLPYYTPCQIRRHNHEGSAWLVAGDTIYDATRFLDCHPGGVQSILRKAGGAADCTRDFEFHSRSAMRMIKKAAVGRVRPCNHGEAGNADASSKEKEWWQFW